MPTTFFNLRVWPEQTSNMANKHPGTHFSMTWLIYTHTTQHPNPKKKDLEFLVDVDIIVYCTVYTNY